MNLPTIRTYGRYASANYGAHCLRVDLGNVTVWYSYRTPIAFRVRGADTVIRENDWGPTTEKHMRWIDTDRFMASRIPGEEFERRFEALELNDFGNFLPQEKQEKQSRPARRLKREVTLEEQLV